MSSKAKTRYLAEKSLYKFVRDNPLFYFWTNTFAGKGVHDKDEAERRVKPLKDRLRRDGAKFEMFWEPHPEGHGWHLHWVTNKYYHLGGGDERTDFRAWMVKRGWGQQMRVERVEASPARVCGNTWVSDESCVRRVVLYLLKYITKNVTDDGCGKKKVWSCSRSCKSGNVRFAWCRWIKPGAYLYHYGKRFYIELYGTLPKFTDFNLVERLGVESTNWLETDPWWMPAGP